MKPWLKWALLGALSVVFGIFALANTVAATLAVTTLTGAVFLILGLFQIVAGFQGGGGGRILSILLGVLVALIGLSFLTNPLEGAISLTMLVTILLMASGIIRLVLAWGMRATPFFWSMLLSGALSILLAIYIVANFATASVSLLGILLGIELLLNGAGLIALAFWLRNLGAGRR